MQSTPSTPPPANVPAQDNLQPMRSREFRPRRAIWPGLLGAAVIAAGVTAALVSHYYDDRSLGAKLDATVSAAGAKVQGGVDGLRDSATGAAQGTADVADRVATAMGDTAITAAVKTSLAADPSLSAAKIGVSTKEGAVLLEGPAPDERSRQRAEVLASAPRGVTRVDNRLVVAGMAPVPAVKAAAMASPAGNTAPPAQ